MPDPLVLALLAIPLTAHAMWFDRPKLGGRDPWGRRALFALSWLAIAGAFVGAIL